MTKFELKKSQILHVANGQNSIFLLLDVFFILKMVTW